MAMINNVRNTVLAIINKNNYGYLSPQDFNLYAQQAQMDIFEDYFYQYNQYINRENLRQSGTGYADIVKNLEEVIDSFSVQSFLSGGTANTWNLPSDYYLWLTGQATAMLRKEIPLSSQKPDYNL